MAFRRAVISLQKPLLIIIVHKTYFFIASKVSKFLPEKDVLRGSLIMKEMNEFFKWKNFRLKKTAVES